MSDSVRPHRWQAIRLHHSWDSRGKNTGVGCYFLLQCLIVKSESEVARLCPTLSDPWTVAYEAPPSMGFSRQEYWSGVPLPYFLEMSHVSFLQVIGKHQPTGWLLSFSFPMWNRKFFKQALPDVDISFSLEKWKFG